LFNSDENCKAMNIFKTLYLNIYASIIAMKRTESIVDELKILHHKREKIVIAPPTDILKSSIKDDIEACIKHNRNF